MMTRETIISIANTTMVNLEMTESQNHTVKQRLNLWKIVFRINYLENDLVFPLFYYYLLVNNIWSW
jgi:hypothetical protein